VSRADSGRNDAVFRRWQSQCSSLRTLERKGAKQSAKRAAAAGLEIERRPTVRARRMHAEKGGDLLLEEVSLEGAEKVCGLGQA
jgi:hypothetical protein